MTEQEQRIAIAKACGWRWGGANGCYIKGDLIARRWEMLPDYLHDLNAMHEAEKIFSEEQRTEYCNRLIEATADKLNAAMQPLFPSHCASASQRAKAFLLCIGKWKD